MIYHPVPPEILTQIGDLTVSFAMLESVISDFVWTLLNMDQQKAKIVTAELSFKNLKALLMSLYKDQHGVEDENFSYVRELMIRAGKVEEIRNQIIHSTWAAGDTKDSVTRIKFTAKEKHGRRVQFENLSVDDLKKIVYNIQRLAYDIQLFDRKLVYKNNNIPFD